MDTRVAFLNLVVAALIVAGGAGVARADRVDDLLAELQEPDQPMWPRLERQLIEEWSRSGSAAADLLLQRGRAAMAVRDWPQAIEHLTALTDHAPEFAEGWYARSEAFYFSDRPGEALADLRRALELNPRHFQALSGVAVILEELGEPERALAAFRAAGAIHPHQPDIKTAIEDLERQVSGQAL
ncbi:tetratricopeptide repeat protein [Halodurantibacterium flavum]|uniref:Tetratricopeptide repeat protein n=1 Tax=Halodurantibacterium flavum TaxID=1382802 RepID=A0ABW4S5Q1_9RHOB